MGRAAVATLAKDLSRDRRAARMVNDLQSRDMQLYELMQGDGPAAAIAGELHNINKQYQMYLTGNYNLVAWSFVQMSNRNNGNLEFMGDYLQFICNPKPCIYDWTGFKIAAPELGENTREDDFRVSPVLFAPRN